MTDKDLYGTETVGLINSRPTEVVPLADGDVFDLRIGPVVKRLGDAAVRMLAYNGSIPGPSLRVRQGSEVVVNVANDGDLDATVHWHGLRLDNRFDGTHQTQHPIPVGGSFTARIVVSGPGHVLVSPAHPPGLRAGNGPVRHHRGCPDRPGLLAAGTPRARPHPRRPAARGRQDRCRLAGRQTTHTAMGRFGDLLLVGGEPDLTLTARAGEVLRLYLVNTANTRVFNVALPGARMKLVGGDSGRVEREQFVETVILAPSERVVVDVLFGEPGRLSLEHHTPQRTYPLAEITVTADPAAPLWPTRSPGCAPTRTCPPNGSGWRPTWTRSRTRRWRLSPK